MPKVIYLSRKSENIHLFKKTFGTGNSSVNSNTADILTDMYKDHTQLTGLQANDVSNVEILIVVLTVIVWLEKRIQNFHLLWPEMLHRHPQSYAIALIIASSKISP